MRIRRFSVGGCVFYMSAPVKEGMNILGFVLKASLKNTIILIIAYIKSRVQHATASREVSNFPIKCVGYLGFCLSCVHNTRSMTYQSLEIV
jgi:hypothetical protein